MSRTVWVRLGSLAAIVGGTTAALFAAFGLVMDDALLQDTESSFVSSIAHFQITVWEATPVVPALYLLALVGLSLQGASRAGALGWIGITTSANGTILIALSAGFWSKLIYSQVGLCVPPSNCSLGASSYYYDTVVVGGHLFGMMLFAAGMIIYGAAALRHQALPRWNGASVLLGLIALLAFASYYLAWRGIDGISYTGALQLSLVTDVITLLLAGAWIALGAALYPRKEEQADPAAIPASGSVG